MSFTKDKPAEVMLLDLLQNLAGQPLPESEGLTLKRVQVAAGQTLFESDRPHPYVYLVRKGLLKLHYLLANGDEWIKSFSHEGMFFGSLTALKHGGLSSFDVMAVEDSELERVDYFELEALAARHPAWLLALYRAMQHFAALKEARERELLTLNPEQRYAAFVQANASLSERLPKKDLARYLGVTPVSLSRIRARLRP
ncbi:Crp/Fnr family transcriptional regulator [Roseateles oligotrophus]|uniref:Crp/Fnr family transcriptional regulator n=1 Tax=Roseateles oligotrophus TaxID=1769250 RepID=A0ABT2YCV3_9BURK|nr:Crp/Fnr family transcriptional regulator [Roseateles oligotrophus]MCV2367856.1 Crp/Fnr family transcriptional regulator [Roseateles oligotrophus]